MSQFSKEVLLGIAAAAVKDIYMGTLRIMGLDSTGHVMANAAYLANMTINTILEEMSKLYATCDRCSGLTDKDQITDLVQRSVNGEFINEDLIDKRVTDLVKDLIRVHAPNIKLNDPSQADRSCN